MEARSYADSDAEAVAAFFASAVALDGTLASPSLGEWRSFTRRSFNHGASDFAVVEAEGAVVALLMSARVEELGRFVRNVRIIVHPSFRRRGIATSLVRLVDTQDDAGDTTIQATCMGKWTAGAALVRRHGLRPERTLRWMSIGSTPPDAPPPAGVTLRPYDGGERDDAAWTRLNDEGYRGSPDHSVLEPADLAALRDEPGFRMLFAEQDDAVVGFCHVTGFGDRPSVESLVTAPARRGRGIGRALLVEALRQAEPNADRRACLSVLDDNAPAVALYSSLGFTTEDTMTTWWREP